MYVCGPMVQFSPIIDGPCRTEPSIMCVPFPILSALLIFTSFSMMPSLLGTKSPRINWFASRRSSGFPASFHQPSTFFTLTLWP